MSQETQPKRRGRPPSGGREAILEAAVAVVREEGIVKLTSRAVAARAGVSDASVYYHFKDRQGLLQAVYAHAMKPLISEPPQPGTPVREAVAETYGGLLRFFEEALPILHSAQADHEVGQAVAEFIDTHDLGPHRGVTNFGGYLRGEQAAGRVNPDADADAAALMLIDVAFSRVARAQLMRPDCDDARLPAHERLLDTIIGLLEP